VPVLSHGQQYTSSPVFVRMGTVEQPSDESSGVAGTRQVTEYSPSGQTLRQVVPEQGGSALQPVYSESPPTAVSTFGGMTHVDTGGALLGLEAVTQRPLRHIALAPTVGQSVSTLHSAALELDPASGVDESQEMAAMRASTAPAELPIRPSKVDVEFCILVSVRVRELPFAK
jgi:hypothetical protein